MTKIDPTLPPSRTYLTSRITTTNTITAAPFGPRSGTPSVSLGVGTKVLHSQSAGEEEVQHPEHKQTEYDAYVVDGVDAKRTLGPVAHGLIAARLPTWPISQHHPRWLR